MLGTYSMQGGREAPPLCCQWPVMRDSWEIRQKPRMCEAECRCPPELYKDTATGQCITAVGNEKRQQCSAEVDFNKSFMPRQTSQRVVSDHCQGCTNTYNAAAYNRILTQFESQTAKFPQKPTHPPSKTAVPHLQGQAGALPLLIRQSITEA